MVEKIDKPEPSPTYFIEPTIGAKGDRKGSGQAQQEFDEYSGSHAAPGWQRIYASAANRRYMRLRREDISHVWFRKTLMQQGVSLAEVDLQLKDGKIIKNAHVILAVREDFWTLKKFQPGQDVQLNLIIKEPIVEISVQNINPAPQMATAQTAAAPIETGWKIDKEKLIIYAAIGVGALLLIVLIALIL